MQLLWTWLLVALGALPLLARGGEVRGQWTSENASASVHFLRPETDMPPQRRVRAASLTLEGSFDQASLFALRRTLKDAQAQGFSAVVVKLSGHAPNPAYVLEAIAAVEASKVELIVLLTGETSDSLALLALCADAVYTTPQGALIKTTKIDLATLDRTATETLLTRTLNLAKKAPFRHDLCRAFLRDNVPVRWEDRVILEPKLPLSLPAQALCTPYGAPPHPLLAERAENPEAILKLRYGDFAHSLHIHLKGQREKLAQGFLPLTPLILGLGLGLVAAALKDWLPPMSALPAAFAIGLTIQTHQWAGLGNFSGMLLFVLACALIALELLLGRRLIVVGVMGAMMIPVAVGLSMADLWPKATLSSVEANVLLYPAGTVLLSLPLAALVFVLLALRHRKSS